MARLSGVITAAVCTAASVIVWAQPASQAASATTQPATTSTSADLVVRTTQPPSPGAQAGDTVFMRYTGKLADGTVFDSTANQGGKLFRFKLGEKPPQVIQGWEKGILGMQVGEKRELVIPPAMAYGPEGRPPTIPANATLTFEIELVGVVRLGDSK